MKCLRKQIGQLLQQVSMGFEEKEEKQEAEKEEAKQFNFNSVFDEHGNFRK